MQALKNNNLPIQALLRAVLILFVACLPALQAACQLPIIELWQGEIPGEIRDVDYRERTDTLEGNRIRISRVTAPTLTPYPAPADKATGTAVIICPGGSYGRLAMDHEGWEVAEWFNEHGISAFVLKYRLPSDAIMEGKSVGPLQDAQEAIRVVRRNARAWNIDPARIGIMGFSAGGHLASTLSTHYDEPVYIPSEPGSARPDFALLIYPVISMQQAATHGESRKNLLGEDPPAELVNHFSNERMVDGETPPAFLVHSADDKAVPVLNSIAYLQALQAEGIPAELHIYQEGGHGYGLAPAGGTESGWPEACLAWLRQNGF